MTKTKKKKMIKLICIVLIIALLIGFIPVWNSGLGLPYGYKTAYGPRGKHWGEIAHPFYFYEDYGSYSTKTNCRDSTGWIPYYENFFEDDKFYFDYNNERYYTHQLDRNVYKETDDSKVGSFIIKEKDGVYNCYQAYRFIFLDDNYIYYISSTRIIRFCFELPTDSGTLRRSYMKYEFYRLNVNNGQNEEIDVDLYLEKINKYDETIKKRY
jgi:hypothetical protein